MDLDFVNIWKNALASFLRVQSIISWASVKLFRSCLLDMSHDIACGLLGFAKIKFSSW